MKPSLLPNSGIRGIFFSADENLKQVKKHRPGISLIKILSILILLTLSARSYSQTNTWDGSSSSNWNTAANWSLNLVPTAAHDVVIPDNITNNITVNTAAVCKSFTISGGGNNQTITISGGQSLTVTDAVTINGPTSGGTRSKVIAVGTGTLSCGSVTMSTTSSDSRDAGITLSTGTVNVTGDITMNGSSARNAIRFTGAGLLNIGGNITGGILVPSSGTVNCNGANPQVLSDANDVSFYNLTINKTTPSNTVTSSGNAFNVVNNLTVTQGTLLLQATNANYTVSKDIIVSTNGTLSHNVDYNATSRLLAVGGNIAIDGLFNYSGGSMVQMVSVGTQNLRTGSNPASAFYTLTLKNGNYYADGITRINDKFWAMYNTGGSFHTNGQNVYAASGVNNSGGTLYVDGGLLDITGQLAVGPSGGTAGAVNMSSGTLNSDGITLGSGLLISGAFTQSGGTNNIAGNLLFNLLGSYVCSNAPDITITGNWTNNSLTSHTPANSTVTFNGVSGTQTIGGSILSHTFNNVTVNTPGQQVAVGGNAISLTLNGNMTISAGSFNAGTASAIGVAGNWVNNGTSFIPGSGTITFNGSAAQTISGSVVTTFNNVTLNNSNGITLNGIDAIIGGGSNTLTLTSGKITTGANKIILGNTGTISGAGATRFINGNLQMGIATGSPSRTFEIGSGTNYAPVTISFASVTGAGNLTGYTVNTDHPNLVSSQLDEDASVNHYWVFTNGGTVFTNYGATFNFQTAAVDAAAIPGNFSVGKYTSAWSYCNVTARTSNSITITNLGSFGDFAIAEAGAGVPTMTTQPSNQTVCSGVSSSINAAAHSKPYSTVQWEISTDGGASYSPLTIAAPYSVSNSNVTAVTYSTLTINPVAGSMNGYKYRAVFTNSRGTVTSNAATYTITPAQTVDAGPAMADICKGGTTAPLGGSIGGSATGATWSATPGGGTFTPNATTLNATWTPPAGYSGTATLTLTTTAGSCASVSASKSQIVANTATANAGSALAAICQGGTSAALGGSVAGSATGGIWSTPDGGTFTPNATTLNATWTPPAAFYGTTTLTLTTTGSACIATASKTLVVNQVATVSAGAALTAICQGGTSAPLGGSIGGAATSGTWSTAAGGTFTPNATTLNATWTPTAGYTGTATLTLTTTGGSCGAVTDSKTQVVNATPGNVTITPASATLCQGSIQSLSVSSGSVLAVPSGTVNLAIPNNNAGGVTSTLAVSGIPATATINSITVTFNVTHPKLSDLIINIKAPNGNVLNLVNQRGGSSANFTNTVVSSIGVNPFTSGSAPFTGTFAADAASGVGATGNSSNVTSFSSLTSTLNGNWIISAKDGVNFNSGTLNSWTITINYNEPISWTPITDLYTDAAATTAYTAGQNLQTVYVKPATAGSPVYTATTTTSAGCSKSQNVTLTVNPKPVVTIVADYCYGGGKIQLTATSTPAGASWLWNTGETTQSILVDVAGNYIVTVTSAAGCTGTGSTTVAQELVVNGDFSAGNTGFTSTYNYTAPTSGSMYPENLYTVYNDPTFTHGTFFGRDHTTNTGNFMIINGSGTTPPPSVWEETVTVLPNTDYYFSAWAVSLNSVGPYANLQFKVNGTQVGTTTGPLPARPHDNNPPYTWTRFYGIWNSGAATSAVVSIIDLETAFGGNDFGIDDISFATLSTFIKLTGPVGTDSQTVCKNTAIANILYTVGSGASGPTVTGLPPGVTSSFNGLILTISGTPTVAGTYNFTITTTGTCNPSTAYGRIIVQEQTITRTSAAATTTQTLCGNTSITNITYSVGGTGTGASVSGLPTGVTGSYSAGVFTISGTPTVAGVYNYTVTTSGTCTAVTATGTITVNAQSISLSSAVGTNAQNFCKNSAITTITYAVGGTATGASVSGLPTGVTGSYSTGVLTISGTPSVAGSFSYTVTTSGSCSPAATASGTITVNQQSISLSSALGTDVQTACINTAITAITYSISGTATNASASGLPTGVSGSYSAGVFTISGTPTIAGVFSYTVTTSGTCTAAIASGTITVSAAAVGGTIASVSICSGASGNVTLTGHTGTVVRWESSIDGGATWTNIVNTGTTQSYTALTQAKLFRALVQNGGCAATVYSNTAKVGIHNLWTGVTNADWNTGTNWSDDQVPTTNCTDVVIPVITSPAVYPQLTSGTASINNLVIHPSATMTISNATLQVRGSITNNGALDVSNGTIELNGISGTQTIAGSMFSGNLIKNLRISNSNGVSFSGTNDTVKVTGVLDFGASNAVLNTNNNLTLVSSASGTASIGDLTNNGANSGNNITGNVTVERFIPNHSKAWQFLAAPTRGQTINNAWQEGNTTLANTTHPGYGTIITSNVAGAVAQGFDVYTASGPTMKAYNPTTGLWDGVASTSIQIADQRGYMFFVRGDRSVTTSSAPATSTILRTTGKLYTNGADAPPVTTVVAGKLASIGNPYPSAIDFRLLTKPAAPAVADLFYVWDPLLTNTANGLGGYQTITAANGWKPIPGGTANYDANVASPYIQSGQAFFVSAASGAGGSVSFTETSKVNMYNMANRPVNTSSDRQFLRLNLYNAANLLTDGNVVAFDQGFDNAVNSDDAVKLTNTSENIGIRRNGTTLALEAKRPVVTEDTVFYNLAGMKLQNYRLAFTPENINTGGLTATLVDKFLSTTTTLNLADTSSVNFQVTTNTGSYAPDRFYVIFKSSVVVLPVTITHISATRNVDKTIRVDWNVNNETSMRMYEVERSADGRNFNKIREAIPTANNGGAEIYNRTDINPLNEDNFYRIKAISKSGQVQYSSIIKVAAQKTTASINIYPNPVVDKKINIQFSNQPKGTYQVQLINAIGQVVYNVNIILSDNNSVQSIQLSRTVTPGDYKLKITDTNGTVTVKQLLLQ